MQQQMSFLDGEFGKMFQELSQATREKISESYLKNSAKSQSRMPRCLRCRRGGGLTQTLSWEMDGAWLTELSTYNIGVAPSVGKESTLSQILEANVPEKYYLSAKACEGILRRANKRGKQLPEMLETALKQQIERMSA